MGKKKQLVRFFACEDFSVIPHSEESTDYYLKRILTAEYLSNPENNHTSKGVEEWAGTIEVPLPVIRRWRRQRDFQALVAKLARQRTFSGAGMATVYNESIKMLSDPDVKKDTKASLLKKLMELDFKREALQKKLDLEEKKRQTKTKELKGVEVLIEEVTLEEVQR